MCVCVWLVVRVVYVCVWWLACWLHVPVMTGCSCVGVWLVVRPVIQLIRTCWLRQQQAVVMSLFTALPHHLPAPVCYTVSVLETVMAACCFVNQTVLHMADVVSAYLLKPCGAAC